MRDSGSAPAIAVAGTDEDDMRRTPRSGRFARRELFDDIAGESGLLSPATPR